MIYLFTDRLFFRLYEAYAFLIEQGIIYVLKKKKIQSTNLPLSNNYNREACWP